MNAWCKNTSVKEAHPDTVPSTEYESLKNIAQIEMILLEYNEEYLNLNEKWNDLRKCHEETLEMVTKVKVYKEVLLGELSKIERECELLKELRTRTEDEVVSDECRDILDLTCALRGLANLGKPDNGRNMTCLSKIGEICTFPVDEFSEKLVSKQDSIEEVGDSRLSIDSTEASDFALLANGHEDSSIEEFVLTEENYFKTGYEQKVKVVLNLKNKRQRKNEARKTSEKPDEDFSKHLRELGEIIEPNCMDGTINIEYAATSNENRAPIVQNSTDCKPNLVEVKETLTIKLQDGEEPVEMNSCSSESLSSDCDDTIENRPDQETIERVPDEVQLANELGIAIIEHEKARGEVIKETVNKLKKLKEEEVYLTKKLNKLMADCLSINQENNEAALLILEKNITGLKSKLNVIDCNVKFIKKESDHKIDRIRINFELKALAERVQLAKAVELLSQLRESQTAEVSRIL